MEKREIKFKVYQCLIGTDNLSYELKGYERINENGNWEFLRIGRDSYLLGNISDNQGNAFFIRSQYTGLKDKNGKEIYEGDILQTQYAKDRLTEFVEFKTGGFKRMFVDNNKKSYLNFHDQTHERSEVIGNIHQNPEQIKL